MTESREYESREYGSREYGSRENESREFAFTVEPQIPRIEVPGSNLNDGI